MLSLKSGQLRPAGTAAPGVPGVTPTLSKASSKGAGRRECRGPFTVCWAKEPRCPAWGGRKDKRKPGGTGKGKRQREPRADKGRKEQHAQEERPKGSKSGELVR